MLRRIACAAVLVTACYTPPTPQCGFVCGVGDACPAQYHCSADRRCHLDGSPATLSCLPDGGLTGEAGTDGADTTPPFVVTVFPVDSATGIGVDTVVSATFDEDITGISSGTFSLAIGGLGLTHSVSYSSSSFTATLVPNEQLPPNTTFTASLDTGISDFSQNHLPSVQMWHFTTGNDLVAPTVIQTFPAANDINISVATTINITFSEPVMGVDLTSFTVNAAGAVTGTIISANNSRTWVFTPTASLPATTSVMVTLTTAITDQSANPLFGGGYVFNFTTM